MVRGVKGGRGTYYDTSFFPTSHDQRMISKRCLLCVRNEVGWQGFGRVEREGECLIVYVCTVGGYVY